MAYCPDDNVFYPEFTRDEKVQEDLFDLINPCNYTGLLNQTLSRPYTKEEKEFLSFKNDFCYEQMSQMIDNGVITPSEVSVLLNTEMQSLNIYPVERLYLADYSHARAWELSVSTDGNELPF